MAFSGAVRNFTFVYFVIITTCFNHITTALMFNLAQISPRNHYKDILTDGAGTYITTEGIRLASHAPTMDSSEDVQSQDRVGRATYAKLLHLWDTASGQLADFTTNFSFVINTDGATDYGDGLSFFLARNSSLSAGGTMGLPVVVNGSNTAASSPFVAVEFDTYWNKDWDPVDSRDLPIGDHVGININSLFSVKAEKWSNITYSKECVVKIQYDSASQNLSVTFTDFQNNTIMPNQFELHYTVDLRSALPEWVIFGFSASSSRDRFQKNSVKSWFFNSSDLHVDQIRWRKDRKKRRLVRVTVVSLCAMLIGLSVAFIVCVFLWKKKPNDENVDQIVRNDSAVKLDSNSHPRAFSFDELSRATNNFEEEKKLGEGGFGAVYRGVLPGGLCVAVKRVSTTSQQGIREYKAEVEIISKARHRHLVQLIGWCHEREGELLVVYELMGNGSLDVHLFKSSTPLRWDVRYKISQGLAKALFYLHEDCSQCVLHRDIKPGNVLLDSEFNPKLGDFGLAKLVDHDKSPETTIPAGTPGYLAPECVSNGKVSRKSDVYSYGAVALVIATGRKSIDPRAQENQVSLVNWVRDLYRKDRILEAVDPKLGDDYHKKQMEGLMILGLWCVHPDPDKRPSIREVLRALNNVANPLSDLPREMPSLVHNSPTPHQLLDSILDNSHRSSASIVPLDMGVPSSKDDTKPNEVSNPNLLVALPPGSTMPTKPRYRWPLLLHRWWYQLEIE